MRSRGIPAEPERVRALAERSGLDPEGLVALMAGGPAAYIGDLGGLADELGLDREEMQALAMAHCFDRDPGA